MAAKASILVLGPLPPPLHGMSNITQVVADLLLQIAPTRAMDMGPDDLSRNLNYHVTRLRRVSKAIAALLVHARKPGATVYLAVDAGLGLFYSIAVVALAHLSGQRLFIHHHSYAYINRSSGPMAWLLRCGGRAASHIFLSPQMHDDFRNRYGAVAQALYLSNAYAVKPTTQPLRIREDKAFAIGHLSNLGREKGLYLFLDLLRQARAAQLPIRGILAGPPTEAGVGDAIEAAQQEFGDALDYRGPLYGDAKQRFYAEIDAFIFPTTYHNEAQPVVLIEALAEGCPVISLDRGVIRGDVPEPCGLVVDDASRFVARALATLTSWSNDPETHGRRRTTCLNYAVDWHQRAQQELHDMLQTIAEPKG